MAGVAASNGVEVAKNVATVGVDALACGLAAGVVAAAMAEAVAEAVAP